MNALLRNKLRAFLTMLGIIIGVASVIAMLGIGQGSKLSIQQQIAGMGLNLVTVVPGSQQRGGVQFGASTMQSLKETDGNSFRLSCRTCCHTGSEGKRTGCIWCIKLADISLW